MPFLFLILLHYILKIFVGKNISVVKFISRTYLKLIALNYSLTYDMLSCIDVFLVLLDIGNVKIPTIYFLITFNIKLTKIYIWSSYYNA